jgi:predicted DNA-binding protein
MDKKTWSTRLDEEAERKIRALIEKSGLKEAEILRRLIMIGLRNIKEPADLLKTNNFEET